VIVNNYFANETQRVLAADPWIYLLWTQEILRLDFHMTHTESQIAKNLEKFLSTNTGQVRDKM
jgi:hypothetical protein